MSSAPVAVIDIGSNSIKALVAIKDDAGDLTALAGRTLDARMGGGMSRDHPRLSEQGMQRGVEAVQTLLAEVSVRAPTRIAVVATSAVRDAQNGQEFSARVYATTGHRVRILSGEEEANLIGRGLTMDPTLRALQDFYVFDLGGGSLECITFRGRRMVQAVSVNAGCVRLTEMFVSDTSGPFSSASAQAVADYTRELLAESHFAFALPAGATAVGTGGTVATVRTILGARDATPFESTSPVVTVAQLRALQADLAALSLADRRKVPGLPPARADVFPTALATLIAVSELGRFPTYVNSLYTLRYGVAAEILEEG